MKEEWLMPGAFVPVDANTTGALIAEIKRLIGVVGGMALNQQRTWVGLTDEEVVDLKMLGRDLELVSMTALRRFARDIAQTLKEKNT